MNPDKAQRAIYCLASVHQTIAQCSKCLECCTEQEKEVYMQITKDLMKHSKNIRNIDLQ